MKKIYVLYFTLLFQIKKTRSLVFSLDQATERAHTPPETLCYTFYTMLKYTFSKKKTVTITMYCVDLGERGWILEVQAEPGALLPSLPRKLIHEPAVQLHQNKIHWKKSISTLKVKTFYTYEKKNKTHYKALEEGIK